MFKSFTWLIGNIMYKWSGQIFLSLMVEALGKCTQQGQVGRTFQIQHPASLLGQVIVIEADFPERFQHLRTTVIDAVWFADEGDHNIAVGCFGE